MKNDIVLVPITTIRTDAPFNNLFRIQEEVLKNITNEMRKDGFDSMWPIVLWMGHDGLVIDGHTRLQAAKNLGLEKVYVVEREFATVDAALEFAIKSQKHRRNLTDSELLKCVRELDHKKKTGPKDNLAQICAKPGKSSKELADMLGVSGRQVEKIRKINSSGSTEIQKALEDGDISIHGAYEKTRKEIRDAKVKAEKLPDSNAFSSPSEKERWERDSRIEAIIGSFEGWVAQRIERELKEYSQIRYSTSEKSKLTRELISIVEKNISKLN